MFSPENARENGVVRVLPDGGERPARRNAPRRAARYQPGHRHGPDGGTGDPDAGVDLTASAARHRVRRHSAVFDAAFVSEDRSMAEDWYADVKKYVPNADSNVVAGIVRYCGIALQNRDSSLVSFSDPAEVGRVRENF